MAIAQVGTGCGPTVLLTWEAAAVIAASLLGVRTVRSRARQGQRGDSEG